MNQKTLVWILALAIVGLSLFWVTKSAGKEADDENAQTSFSAQNLSASILQNQNIDKDWVKGNASATITLVEYSDFQCPACAYYYPFVKKLEEEFGSDIKIVYRQFPLTTIHANALIAAYASEAAGLQGKFWEMHDKLFENQSQWSLDSEPFTVFLKYAIEIGLDTEQFKTDILSQAVADSVKSDVQSGLDVGLNGTPSFFLNGEKIKNLSNYEEFSQPVKEAVESR